MPRWWAVSFLWAACGHRTSPQPVTLNPARAVDILSSQGQSAPSGQVCGASRLPELLTPPPRWRSGQAASRWRRGFQGSEGSSLLTWLGPGGSGREGNLSIPIPPEGGPVGAYAGLYARLIPRSADLIRTKGINRHTSPRGARGPARRAAIHDCSGHKRRRWRWASTRIRLVLFLGRHLTRHPVDQRQVRTNDRVNCLICQYL